MVQEKKRIYEIKPLGKWKRFLLFFGDYFITFILSFILFNLAVFPLARVINNTEKKSKESEQYEETANNLLINQGIMFKSVDSDPTFMNDVNYTFKVFLSYYAFDDINVDATYKQYGHRLENEVIRHYFVDLKGNHDGYLSAFKTVNDYCLEDKKMGYQLFEIGPNIDDVSLKSDYKTILANELLEVDNDDDYSQTMQNFRDNVFARLFYMHVYNDIIENDLVVDGVSFNACMAHVSKTANELKWVAAISALVSVILSWSFAYLIYPLINKDNRTPTMSVMKIERLDFHNLGPINKKIVLVQSIYHLLLSFTSLVFLPMLYFGLSYSFGLPLLFIFTIFSAVLSLISMMFVFFNQHNRSGSDILTYTVIVPTSEMDNLYREKLEDGCLSSQGSSE